MKFSSEVFYQAVLARDRRFDGKFFVAVKTTGIYCRPICPARPKRENIEFFRTGLAAEKAGYRPCLRCRPECAPGSPAWHGTSATVERGLQLIAKNRRADLDENQFSELLGVSSRHLRRLFEQEIGKSPKQIQDIYRLDFARQLIVETRMPMTEVAMSSGFSSLRRFNDAVKKRFGRSPTDLRSRRKDSGDDGLRLSLAYRPPFDWESLLGFHRNHLIEGVERVDDDSFSRVFRAGKSVGCFSVHPSKEGELILKINSPDPKLIFWIVQNVRQMFDLDSDPLLIGNAFENNKLLAKLYADRPGLRFPCSWDPFEGAICTILGQLVSTDHARMLIRQLVESEGEKVGHPITGEDAYLFPTPEKLANAKLDSLKTTGRRKETIRELSRQVWKGELKLDPSQDTENFKEALCSIKGIGPWSAECISWRSLGDTDAYPSTDLILMRVHQNFPKLKIDNVKPWRGYAAIHFWREFADVVSKKRGKKS